MPKPVLSDSLFNADDVATALVNHYNLSVSNQDFAVVDRTSEFTNESDMTVNSKKFFSFNGFMFFMIALKWIGDTPQYDELIFTNTNANTRPSEDYFTTGIGKDGDVVEWIKFESNGNVRTGASINSGSSNAFIVTNGWYRF